MLRPAGSPSRVRSSGRKDQLHLFLEPGLVGRVAAEAFDLDPARLTVPPLAGLELPHLRAAMPAVGPELRRRGPGGRPAAVAPGHPPALPLLRPRPTARLPEP